MDDFSEKMQSLLADFGKGRKMVLSTSAEGLVSSRMVSVVQLDGIFYFQTDMTMKKYRQIAQNHHVALCIDNFQIEGICEEKGHPLDNAAFCKLFRECYKGSFDAYTSLKNERLFSVKPLHIERWVYQGGVPYLEFFDVNNRKYRIDQYAGV